MLEAEILTKNDSTFTRLNRNVYLRASLLKASSFFCWIREASGSSERAKKPAAFIYVISRLLVKIEE